MTIANLGELRGAIEDNLARNDLQSLFPVYVKIFESKFNTSVRIAEMEVATTLDVTNGVATLPSGFLELRNVQGQESNPTYYLSGTSLVFTSAARIRLMFFITPSYRHWLMTLILIGCCLAILICICMVLLLSLVFLCKIAQLVQINKALYESALGELKDADLGRRWGGASIVLTSPTP
jgi:hypothetical protein